MVLSNPGNDHMSGIAGIAQERKKGLGKPGTLGQGIASLFCG